MNNYILVRVWLIKRIDAIFCFLQFFGAYIWRWLASGAFFQCSGRPRGLRCKTRGVSRLSESKGPAAGFESGDLCLEIQYPFFSSYSYYRVRLLKSYPLKKRSQKSEIILVNTYFWVSLETLANPPFIYYKQN